MNKGDIIGQWTILGDAPTREYVVKNGARAGRILKNRYVLARCSCGIKKEVYARDLERKRGLMCFACSQRIKLKKINANKAIYKLKNKYGDWTTLFEYKLKKMINRKYKALFCKCRCKCGVERFLKASALRTGRTKRCAKCHLKEINTKNNKDNK